MRPVEECQIVQPVPVVERRIVQPVVERWAVRVIEPLEGCRLVVTRRTNAFGVQVVTRSRSCD